MKFLKAANVRALVPMCAELARQYRDASDEVRRHMLAMICKLSKLYDIMHSSGLVVPEASHLQMVEASDKFLLHYNWLSKAAVQNTIKMWLVVPKFHYHYHLVEGFWGLNPKYFWCYGGEDLVGRASTLCHSCVRGTANHEVSSKMLEKYRVAMHLKWTRLG